jgi:hypothetical protein
MTTPFVIWIKAGTRGDVIHGAFGFDRGAGFFLSAFAPDLAALAFALARAALGAAAHLSGDHGVYRKSG